MVWGKHSSWHCPQHNTQSGYSLNPWRSPEQKQVDGSRRYKDRLMNGQKAQWPCSTKKEHTLSRGYTCAVTKYPSGGLGELGEVFGVDNWPNVCPWVVTSRTQLQLPISFIPNPLQHHLHDNYHLHHYGCSDLTALNKLQNLFSHLILTRALRIDGVRIVLHSK